MLMDRGTPHQSSKACQTDFKQMMKTPEHGQIREENLQDRSDSKLENLQHHIVHEGELRRHALLVRHLPVSQKTNQ